MPLDSAVHEALDLTGFFNDFIPGKTPTAARQPCSQTLVLDGKKYRLTFHDRGQEPIRFQALVTQEGNLNNSAAYQSVNGIRREHCIEALEWAEQKLINLGAVLYG